MRKVDGGSAHIDTNDTGKTEYGLSTFWEDDIRILKETLDYCVAVVKYTLSSGDGFAPIKS